MHQTIRKGQTCFQGLLSILAGRSVTATWQQRCHSQKPRSQAPQRTTLACFQGERNKEIMFNSHVEGSLTYSPLSGGSVLYTQEPEFLMFISGPVFQLIPIKLSKSQENLTLDNRAELPSRKSLSWFTDTLVLHKHISTLTVRCQKP